MTLQQWALPELRHLLPLDDGELEQVISYASTLPDSEAAEHLGNLLGDSPQATEFVASFLSRRVADHTKQEKHQSGGNEDAAAVSATPVSKKVDEKAESKPPPYTAGPQVPPAASGPRAPAGYHHSNDVTKASDLRAKDEQQMQQVLQDVQYKYRIFNSEIEPEHETEYPCSCPIHQYMQMKWRRIPVQKVWCKAVMYPGESFYTDNPYGSTLFSGNPYKLIGSPNSLFRQQSNWSGIRSPDPYYHALWINKTIALNNRLNQEGQARVNSYEPRSSIWNDEDSLSSPMEKLSVGDKKGGDALGNKRLGVLSSADGQKAKSSSVFSGLKKALGARSAEEKELKTAGSLRKAILEEERGRWPDEEWRQMVRTYQDKVGMTAKIAELRQQYPIQYLHLLKAGYFEPIPVAWATRASNPLKFSVEAASGWRGITPTWRGYEDLAEERLYWVLNHREGSLGSRMKPDFISEINMAKERMARAVDPPPLYFSADDTCHLQHTSKGYSKQVMPPPFRPFDQPETPLDDTMILLDVSGSMDFNPVRPVYQQYLVTCFRPSTQPKNKDVARSIVRRFTDAMANHDHRGDGYDLVTFSDRGNYIGTVNHKNLENLWHKVHFGGGTRVMTGWQLVKELHFQKHSQSATHHPVYGWQAGPQTPILRLLLLLDGEATDMDEFELDLLGLSWAHVTIFLIGVDGCPHHHRHANELQRISDVNHHVSFVDAQGNCPERFVTHELLKRHLGYDISMAEFERMEELPAYSEYAGPVGA